ncbi:methyltransferase [Microcoleus sp. FACHB-68]|uniref:methyltransferase n=1 Tax=Microcoleus sp. FACHB-68 TaxID=2692826 RepID=UPI0016886EC8|nr:methyltransferase [Microcoleus sp. FACHB-68]MBD1936312.1 hypothetical protein [Microcoleus sp. FACHB-68]
MSQTNPMPNSNETPTPMAMMQMISSRWVSQPLYVAAELGMNEAFMGKLVDLEMPVIAGGRERTETEYRPLLGAAGFELTNIVPTQTPLSVIESVPV